VKSLLDLVALKRGYDLPSQDRQDGEIPILGSFGITGRHIRARGRGPGVSIGRSGASIGVATYTDRPFWPLNTTLYVTDFKGNDPRFVYYVLDSIDFRAFNSGGAIPSLNRNYLGAINLPDLAVSIQGKIAAILSAYDDLIENNNGRIKLLEEMAQRIYREWFVDLRHPGHEAVPLVESELGPIPEGWNVAPVGSVTDVLGGGTPSKKVVAYWEPGTITWFTPTDLTSAG
jgi:type I restriction enzyme S subunit